MLLVVPTTVAGTVPALLFFANLSPSCKPAARRAAADAARVKHQTKRGPHEVRSQKEEGEADSARVSRALRACVPLDEHGARHRAGGGPPGLLPKATPGRGGG